MTVWFDSRFLHGYLIVLQRHPWANRLLCVDFNGIACRVTVTATDLKEQRSEFNAS